MAIREEEILVLKPSSLGDIVHTLPAVRRLKAARPAARIRWVVNSEWAPLLRGNPDLEEIIPFPRAQFRGLRWTLPFWRWARGLRRFRPELALDFQGLFRSGLMARASGARRILCLSDAELLNRTLATQVVPMRPEEHAVDRYLRLITALGLAADTPAQFPLPPGEPMNGLPPGFVLLHPFSRGEGKSLNLGQTLRFCRELGDTPVVLVGRAEADLPQFPDNVANLLNQTSLEQLIGLIRQSAFVVSVDSGPMHIAAALTPRLLSLHTWSDPRLVGPYDPRAWIWKAGQILHRPEVTARLARCDESPRTSDMQVIARFVLARTEEVARR